MPGIEIISSGLSAPSAWLVIPFALLTVTALIAFAFAIAGALDKGWRFAGVALAVSALSGVGAVQAITPSVEYARATTHDAADTLAALEEHYDVDLPEDAPVRYGSHGATLTAIDRRTHEPIDVVMAAQGGRLVLLLDAGLATPNELRSTN